MEKGSRFLKNSQIAVVPRATVEGIEIVGQARPVPAGSVQIYLDLNNDTELDEQDLPSKNGPEPAFAFWEAQKENLGNPDGLMDMATVRLHSKVAVPRLRIAMHGSESVGWALTEKMAKGGLHGYLQRKEEAERQWLYTKMGAGCISYMGYAIGDCPASGSAPIELVNVRAGNRDFLMRCELCPRDDKRYLTLHVETDRGTYTEVQRVRVDIRPLNGWMTIYTAHDPARGRPRAELTRVDGWAAVPSNAPRATILMHGFAVSQASAVENSFPKMFKRLYWAGHPVLSEQEDPSHVIGIAWPGDVGSPDQVNFPEDEFSAFQTGVPVSRFLSQLRGSGVSRIGVMAHSLGNLVMNNAIALAQDRIVDKLIMVDAAVAREAFDAAYRPTEIEIRQMIGVIGGPTDSGFPDNDKWAKQWDLIIKNKLVQPNAPQCETLDGITPTNEEQCASDYYLIKRATPGMTDSQRAAFWTNRWTFDGKWRGIFEGNLQKTSLVNFYNPLDQVFELVVNAPWYASQVLQKPRSVEPLFWLRLNGLADPSQTDVWAAPPPDAAALTRKWAELAMFFQPLSGAAGNSPIPVSGIVNVPFASAGGDGGFWNYKSHTYLTSRPYYDVFELYKAATAALNLPK